MTKTKRLDLAGAVLICTGFGLSLVAIVLDYFDLIIAVISILGVAFACVLGAFILGLISGRLEDKKDD